jgi:hypothetical protein
MLSTELEFNPRLDGTGRMVMSGLWELFQMTFSEAFEEPNQQIPLNLEYIYKTKQASVWNAEDKTGQRVGIAAVNKDNTFAFVIFLDEPDMTSNIYRTEDLEDLGITYKELNQQKQVENEKV